MIRATQIVITRRKLLERTAALGAMLAAGATLSGRAIAATDASAPYTQAFEDLRSKLLGGREPQAENVAIELPEFAENGNTVPYRISIASPMTDADHVKTVHLLSSANPQAHVATFHLSPRSGRAEIAGRMRLAKSQDVIVLAETSAGALLSGLFAVKVTIGGCGSE